MKNLPVAISALLGFGLIFWPDAPEPEPVPPIPPVVDGDLINRCDEAYRQELARLVGQYSAGDWTTATKEQWTEAIASARAETHSEVADKLARAFADGTAAGLVEPIRNGVFE